MVAMTKSSSKKKSNRGQLVVVVPIIIVVLIAIVILYRVVDPAPANHLVISTSDGEGDYDQYAKLYQDIFKDDGIKLEIRQSTGSAENYARLKDPKSDVDVGFVQDGLGTPDDAPDLVSLGSLYYEPIWIFYHVKLDRGHVPMTRFSHLLGKKIAVGHVGGGTRLLSERILKAAGVDDKNSHFVDLGWKDAATALRNGQVDAAIFLSTPEDAVIRDLIHDPDLRLMSMDQAEAVSRQIPFLHHLVLPHGAMDLKKGLPDHDIDMVSPTATLLVRDSVHPALKYLLLKAASQVHDDPGIFEKRNEFPIDKVDQFPLADEARSYYKNGIPFWQKHLPFWLATLLDRFLLIIIPIFALAFPILKSIPQAYKWRIRTRIYKLYGELKYLETAMKNEEKQGRTAAQAQDHLSELDRIEEKVKLMKVPLEFAEHLYSLRGHIDFVRLQLKAD